MLHLLIKLLQLFLYPFNLLQHRIGMKLILCSLQKFFQYILMIIRNHPIGLDEGTLQDFLRNAQPDILMILGTAVPGMHCQ